MPEQVQVVTLRQGIKGMALKLERVMVVRQMQHCHGWSKGGCETTVQWPSTGGTARKAADKASVTFLVYGHA